MNDAQHPTTALDPTTETPPDVVDDQTSDVLNEDEIVHVPAAVEQLVESHEAHSTYAPEVPHWEPGERPEAAA